MDRSDQLGKTPISQLLLQFSLPAIVGMVAQALYNLIDRVFIGHALGAPGIAGITVAFPFMLVVLAFSMLIGLGGTAMISIYLGQQRKSEAEQVLGNVCSLLALTSIAITAVGIAFVDPILRLGGASPDVLPLGRDYLRIIALGAAFQLISFGLNATIRGEGNPRMAMVSMLISVLLNAILAPIFIFGFDWGMQGAALATVTGQAATSLWIIAYFLGPRSVLKLRTHNLLPRSTTCLRIVTFGSAHFMMQLAAAALQGIMNYQLGRYGGDVAISVMGILYTVFMLVGMPIFGINQGAQPIIGYNYGAQRFDRVKRTLELAIGVASAIALGGFLVLMAFPAQVIQFFNRQDQALINLGIHAMRLATLALPVVGFQIVGASYFQAIGKPRQAMLLMLSRQLLILIPAALILPRFFGLDGVWAALPTSDLAASVLTGICLLFELRRLKANSSHG